MTGDQINSRRSYWETATVIPDDVYLVWRKSDLAISPVAVVATVDEDGSARTAPFGSLRAVSQTKLRLCTLKKHETYKNLCRDGRISVSMIAPGIAVSVKGKAQIVRKRMETDEDFAIVDIEIEEVKNDFVYRVIIDSGITIHPREGREKFYNEAMLELEEFGSGDD